MPLTKLRRGVLLEMTPQEEADFIASRIPTLSKAKEQVFAEIKAKRNEVERAGAAHSGRVVSATPESIARLVAAQEASTPGQQIPVELLDGSVVKLPAASLSGLLVAARARLLAAMNTEAIKQAEVDALLTPQAVLAYDINTGWPA